MPTNYKIDSIENLVQNHEHTTSLQFKLQVFGGSNGFWIELNNKLKAHPFLNFECSFEEQADSNKYLYLTYKGEVYSNSEIDELKIAIYRFIFCEIQTANEL